MNRIFFIVFESIVFAVVLDVANGFGVDRRSAAPDRASDDYPDYQLGVKYDEYPMIVPKKRTALLVNRLMVALKEAMDEEQREEMERNRNSVDYVSKNYPEMTPEDVRTKSINKFTMAAYKTSTPNKPTDVPYLVDDNLKQYINNLKQENSRMLHNINEIKRSMEANLMNLKYYQLLHNQNTRELMSAVDEILTAQSVPENVLVFQKITDIQDTPGAIRRSSINTDSDYNSEMNDLVIDLDVEAAVNTDEVILVNSSCDTIDCHEDFRNESNALLIDLDGEDDAEYEYSNTESQETEPSQDKSSVEQVITKNLEIEDVTFTEQSKASFLSYYSLKGNAADPIEKTLPEPKRRSIPRRFKDFDSTEEECTKAVNRPRKRDNCEMNKASKKRRMSTKKSDDNMKSIGSNGSQIERLKYESIEWNNYTKATRFLLVAFFTRDILASSTLSGKPSPAFLDSGREVKKQLDQYIIQDIVECVSRKCNVHPKVVRQTITTKCADECKLLRIRTSNDVGKRRRTDG